MDAILEFIAANVDHAYIIIFLLFILAGFYLPISEDVLLITGGALVSIYRPEKYFLFYTWLFFGAWISAWEIYWIGRLLGPRLYEIKWLSWLVSAKKIEKLHFYYERFGVFTFIIGRFIPGGMRNALFTTAGMGKMPFWKFMLRDGCAALISTSVIFYIGYVVGENYRLIVQNLIAYNRLAFAVIFVCLFLGVSYYWFVHKKRKGR